MTDKSKMIWMYVLIYTILIPVHLIVFLYFFFAIAQEINRLDADISNIPIYLSIVMSIYIEVLTYIVYRVNLKYNQEKNKKIFMILLVVNPILMTLIIGTHFFYL